MVMLPASQYLSEHTVLVLTLVSSFFASYLVPFFILSFITYCGGRSNEDMRDTRCYRNRCGSPVYVYPFLVTGVSAVYSPTPV